MSEPNSKMEDLMNETKSLIDTLERLNEEIESYQVAKNNLVEVKDKLAQFTGEFAETSSSIHKNIAEMNNHFETDLSSVLKNLSDIKEMNQRFQTEINSVSDNLFNTIEQDKVYFDKKINMLTGVSVLNALVIIAVLVLVLI